MATWTKAPKSPFGEIPERIPLDPDPLVRVVAQVRFARVLSVREQSFVAPFQEAIRHSYPLVEKETQEVVAPGAGGALQVAESVLWRFSDAVHNWKVTLSEDFVALDCNDYSNRTDFLFRLGQTLGAVDSHVGPVLTSRVGVRYTDRLSDPDKLEQLPEFVRPELLGMANAELGTGEAVSELTQAEFVMGQVRLRGRWGHLPPGATHDVSIEAVESPSWVLDLDAFTETTTPFDQRLCAAEAGQYAGIVYGFFRWAISDEFLAAHGAEL
ncbi:MAG: TIGR04255 family protein [Acidimicrobiaceae bacterium]|nr:TIGR04255 family protein [Acidimicrobiaceae bacterium]